MRTALVARKLIEIVNIDYRTKAHSYCEWAFFIAVFLYGWDYISLKMLSPLWDLRTVEYSSRYYLRWSMDFHQVLRSRSMGGCLR